MTSISKTNRSNRIIKANKVPHPIGFPDLSPEEDWRKRMEMFMRALKSLQEPLTEQKIFV